METTRRNPRNNYDKNQMLANMNKCAADIAYKAVQAAGYFFDIITVIGMLVDYKANSMVKTYKLVFDFKGKRATLRRCEKAEK